MERRKLLTTLGGVGAGVAGALLVGGTPAEAGSASMTTGGSAALALTDGFVAEAGKITGEYCHLLHLAAQGKATFWDFNGFRRNFTVVADGNWDGLCTTLTGARTLMCSLSAPHRLLHHMAPHLQEASVPGGDFTQVKVEGDKLSAVIAIESLREDPTLIRTLWANALSAPNRPRAESLR